MTIRSLPLLREGCGSFLMNGVQVSAKPSASNERARPKWSAWRFGASARSKRRSTAVSTSWSLKVSMTCPFVAK